MKGLSYILVVVITSLYFFPIQFTYFLPAVNTKLFMGCFGVILMLYDLAKKGKAIFDSNLLSLILYSLVVSFCGILSVTLNNTPDYAYATYVGSMLVWFCGAYFIVRLIKTVHGYVNFRLIVNYLTAVCVLQCGAAIMNDNFPSFKKFINTYVQQGQQTIEGLEGTKRKYGIGASLDVAGTRFSAVLILIPALVASLADELKKKWMWLYLLCFLFIFIEGNIIARTTTVGAIIALVYIIIRFKSFKTSSELYNKWLGTAMVSLFIIGCSATIYLYKTNESFEKDMRFGFEGFFSLFESGEWNVGSNDKLKSMYVFPDSSKSWLIGDGYFSNPINTDPYFIGKITGGYYMGTDVGFLRFIFYFGLLGFAAFCLFFMECGRICTKDYPRYKLAFYLLVALQFAIWLKVSTDIFVVFALFIAANMVTKMKNLDAESLYRNKEEEEEETTSSGLASSPSSLLPPR